MTPVDSAFQKNFTYILTQPSAKVSKESRKARNSSEHPVESDQQIGKLLYPILALVRLSGCCPVKIVSSPGKYFYEVKWLSAPALISLQAAAIGIFFMGTWISNALYESSWPIKIFRSANQDNSWLNKNLLKGSELVITLDNIVRLCMPLGSCISGLLHWINVTSLCIFLNEWPRFFSEFRSAFDPHYKLQLNLTKRLNLICVVWSIPVILALLVLKPVNFLLVDDWPLGIPFGLFMQLYVIGVRILCYVKDFLLLETLKAVYGEVRRGIKAQYEECQTSIRKDQVRAWMNLIVTIRTQAVYLESYLSWHNLWSIFEVFYIVLVILSMVVFLFLNHVLSGAIGNFLPFSLVVTTFFLLSLGWKAHYAEDILNEEEAIAEEIMEMDTGNECETRLQMKLICDVIYNDPIRIRVGNMLTLNKRLILSFWSQLASYLVVIIQFIKN